AIVDEEQLVAAIGVRMGIRYTGLSVRGPTGMGDSRHAVMSGVPNLAFEFSDFADRPGKISCRIQNQNAARVVATILQPLESLDQDFLGGLISRVRHYSTHRSLLAADALFTEKSRHSFPQ